jgi:hypothetical protein
MAQVELLEVVAGTTLTADLELLDRDMNPVTDLVGAVGYMQVRDECGGDLIIEEQAVITPEAGTVQFRILASATPALLPVGKLRKFYKYGCRIEYSDGSVVPVMTGRLLVTCGVVSR